MAKQKKIENRETAGIAIRRKAKISASKARLVIDQIRGMRVVQALAILEHTQRRTNPIVLDLLKSAVANAVQQKSANPDELIITEARVDQGPMLKRMRPRAMGRGMQIQKKTAHIILAVG